MTDFDGLSWQQRCLISIKGAFRRASFFAKFLHASVSVCTVIQNKLHILAS